MKEEIKKQIKAHALEDPSIECCGLLIFNKKTKQLETLKSPNLSANKANLFSISPASYLKASLLGEIIATYHSHVEGDQFSEYDKQNSELNKIKYILYSIDLDSFQEYVPKGYVNQYYGREFYLGKQDCLSLLIEYYKKELNVDIKNYYRDDSWLIKNPDCYARHYQEEGFETIQKGPLANLSMLQKHDVILMKLLGKANPTHSAIYVGDGVILHHQLNCYSRIEPYSQTFMDRTTHVLRLKDI